ncbi:GTPase IMAP family member 1 [Triplophysa tibetana]|uniref:GTPase IMAP family member 1 n=1 Tax=Triplophysa tibetana TaxID=1572043 RepID=A0A5A9P470_9TELE|nr:GTPase IMAP family member 1 [Triplophysa tibetana]
MVETPDWFCSGLSLEEVRQDVRRCIGLSAPGPHAFLLVIPVHQSTGAEREMKEKMEEIFGQRWWENTLILFTVTDKVQEKNIEDFVQSGNQEVQRLVEKCGNRFHCLNIHQSEDGSQVSELLEKIEKMMEGNTERSYSSEIYLENFLKKIEGKIEEHEGDIKQLNERTVELERQMREERDEGKNKELMRELEKEVRERTELKRVIDQLKDHERESSEMEEKHRQEKIRQEFGQIRFEAEKKHMMVILSKLQRNMLDSRLKMQEEIIKQLEERNRESETLKENLSELNERYLVIPAQGWESCSHDTCGGGGKCPPSTPLGLRLPVNNGTSQTNQTVQAL